MLPLIQINKSSYTSLSHLLSVEWNRDYVWININITSMKERLVVFINIKPLKKEIRLQKVDMITELGNKNNKRKKGTTYGFIFITSLSFGFLGDRVEAVVVEAWPLPWSSSFEGMGKVASTISIL